MIRVQDELVVVESQAACSGMEMRRWSCLCSSEDPRRSLILVSDVLGVAKRMAACKAMEIGPRPRLCSSGGVKKGLI